MPQPQTDKPLRMGYGYLNGLPIEKGREIMARYEACKKAGHTIGGTSTQRGDHSHWCDTCHYSFQIDSSG